VRSDLRLFRNLVPVAKERLEGTGVKVARRRDPASPSGQYPTKLKIADVRSAVELGADEIDMVIDRGAFLSGRYAKVYDEVVQTKEACGDAHLKVILETGELGTYDNVRRATLLRDPPAAARLRQGRPPARSTPPRRFPSRSCMLEAVRDVYEETGRRHRLQGRRRHPRGEAGDPAPRARARDARSRLAHTPTSTGSGASVAAERHPHAAPQGEDGPRTKAPDYFTLD